MRREREEGFPDKLLVRLPDGISDLVDNEIEAFTKDPKNQSLNVLSRYQNVDLWMVVEDLTGENDEIVQTRVTLGAYEGKNSFKPDLYFMPDKILSGPRGRFILPAQVRRQGHSVLSFDTYDPEKPELFLSSVRANLTQSWEKAQAIPIDQIRILLPELRSS